MGRHKSRTLHQRGGGGITDGASGSENLAKLREHIEEGYSQALRGELIDSDKARAEIEAMKRRWRWER